MKKVCLVALIISVLCLTLCGCGKKDNQAPNCCQTNEKTQGTGTIPDCCDTSIKSDCCH